MYTLNIWYESIIVISLEIKFRKERQAIHASAQVFELMCVRMRMYSLVKR